MSKHDFKPYLWAEKCTKCGAIKTEHNKQKRCNHKAGNHKDGTQKVGHNKSWIRRLNWLWRTGHKT